MKGNKLSFNGNFALHLVDSYLLHLGGNPQAVIITSLEKFTALVFAKSYVHAGDCIESNSEFDIFLDLHIGMKEDLKVCFNDFISTYIVG